MDGVRSVPNLFFQCEHYAVFLVVGCPGEPEFEVAGELFVVCFGGYLAAVAGDGECFSLDDECLCAVCELSVWEGD